MRCTIALVRLNTRATSDIGVSTYALGRRPDGRRMVGPGLHRVALHLRRKVWQLKRQ